MGAADDIRDGLTKSLANFAKQRKAEEKHVSAGRWRIVADDRSARHVPEGGRRGGDGGMLSEGVRQRQLAGHSAADFLRRPAVDRGANG